MANRFGAALRSNMKESENRVEKAINGQPEPIVNKEQGGVGQIAQPIPAVNQQMQSLAQPVTPVESRAVSLGGPLVYNEATKGISVKLPYSLYDALDTIKKQTQRTGNRNDRMGIGDLVVLAVKEFVERNA